MKKQSESREGLNKIQKFYIANHAERDPKALAVDVGCSVKDVRAYFKTLKTQEQRKASKEAKEIEEGKTKTTTQIRADDLMGKNKRKGVVIMTQAASELGDEHRRTHKMSDRLAQHVQKIRPE